jgi:hypothetical protein
MRFEPGVSRRLTTDSNSQPSPRLGDYHWARNGIILLLTNCATLSLGFTCVNHLVVEIEAICHFIFYKLVICSCCWRNPGLWIDDRVGRIEATRVWGGDKGWIRLHKGKNLGSQWHFRCPCGLSMGRGGPWIAFPLFGKSGSSPPTLAVTWSAFSHSVCGGWL